MAVAPGTDDAALNADIILFTGVMTLVYLVSESLGVNLKDTAVNAFLYKNSSGGDSA